MDTQISDLRAIAADISTYFQTKLPLDKTIDLWFKKLDGMNLRSAHHRIVDIITNGDSLPRNFPAAVKSAYSSWLRDQPKDFQTAGCSHCLDGLIHAKDKNGNVYAFKCGHCRSHQVNFPEATRYWLEEHGYSLDWHHDFNGPVDINIKKKIQELKPTPAYRELGEPEKLLLKKLREQPPVQDEVPF